MARDYARIMTAIWKNKDFRALCEGDQRLYILLATQPDIDAAGVLKISLEWWADMAIDSRPEDLAQRLRRLEAGRFIGLDRLSGEVLLRSFIRWDGGFHNPKRRPVITRAIEEVRSDRLVQMIDGELRRAGVPELMPHREPDSQPEDWSPDPPDDDDRDGPEMVTDPTFPQVECLPGREPGSEPGSDMVTTSVSSERTATHNPGTTTPPKRRPTADDETDAADTPLAIDDGFDEFWAIYPRKVKKVDARKAWRTARRRKVPARELIEAARRHAAGWLMADKPVDYIPYPASWLRGGAYADEPEFPSTTADPAGRSRSHLRLASGAPRIPTTTTRVQAALAYLDPEEP